MSREPSPDSPAEAHLWLTLVEAGATPKDISIWAVKVDNKNRIKQDSPCPNCQQWVFKEFKSVNQH